VRDYSGIGLKVTGLIPQRWNAGGYAEQMRARQPELDQEVGSSAAE